MMEATAMCPTGLHENFSTMIQKPAGGNRSIGLLWEYGIGYASGRLQTGNRFIGPRLFSMWYGGTRSDVKLGLRRVALSCPFLLTS